MGPRVYASLAQPLPVQADHLPEAVQHYVVDPFRVVRQVVQPFFQLGLLGGQGVV